MNSKCRYVAGFLLAGVASAANADSFASATLAAVKLTLIDLDPTDGILPSITFLDSSDTYRGSVFVKRNFDNMDGAPVLSPVAFYSFARQASFSDALAVASFTTDVTGIGGTHVVRAQASFGKDRNYAAAQAIGARNQFKISDRTLLMVTATSTLNVDVTHSWSGTSVFETEVAQATNRIQLWGAAAGGEGTGTQQSDALQELYQSSLASWNAADGSYSFSPAQRSESSALSASFVNLSGGELMGTLATYSNVVSVTPGVTTPVPELHSAWLLLAGLGAGATLRGRRR